MKTYRGYRLLTVNDDGLAISDRCIVRVHSGEYFVYDLPARQDLRNHSPDGFEWGYGGSGPAQLALALVADCWGEEYAVPKIYQRVKLIIAKLPRDGWKLTNDEVDAVIAAAVKSTGFVPEVFSDE